MVYIIRYQRHLYPIAISYAWSVGPLQNIGLCHLQISSISCIGHLQQRPSPWMYHQLKCLPVQISTKCISLYSPYPQTSVGRMYVLMGRKRKNITEICTHICYIIQQNIITKSLILFVCGSPPLRNVFDVDADVDDGDGVVGRIEFGIIDGDADAVPLRTELAALSFVPYSSLFLTTHQPGRQSRLLPFDKKI